MLVPRDSVLLIKWCQRKSIDGFLQFEQYKTLALRVLPVGWHADTIFFDAYSAIFGLP